MKSLTKKNVYAAVLYGATLHDKVEELVGARKLTFRL